MVHIESCMTTPSSSSPMAKRGKHRESDNEGNKDMLSDLPDSILLHILSLLKVKLAVQTCLLSTRWKNHWKHIPTLALHSSDFSTSKSFTKFTSTIFTLRDGSTALHGLELNSLIIDCCSMEYEARILCISSTTLVNLIVLHLGRCKIELSASCLHRFACKGSSDQYPSGSSISSVHEVDIDAHMSSYSLDNTLFLLTWLQGLVNITSLAVSSNTLQPLIRMSDSTVEMLSPPKAKRLRSKSENEENTDSADSSVEKPKRGRHSESESESVSDEENKDRLSDLPDCVLLHILSFLSAKYAVRTCILSSRWKDLWDWKHLPSLILHSTDFSTLKIFTKFVSKLLELRDSSLPLHSFDFKRHGSIEYIVHRRVVDYALSHNVQRLVDWASP
ncbi:uncharacterized protein LOC130747908 [Lotus japonicus]|uniref:uncharacterized protein LOC130747908 n=1 Tax=Lotus japonicus TaxID=34305 RepID=UPI00258932D9|nr:uncharacterized protein LOC130747908 [Lotus japonicus]